MSLINCPECNWQVSSQTEICSNCGFPIKKTKIIMGLPLKFVDEIDTKHEFQSKDIIGESIKINNLEVAQFDFPSQMNLKIAKDSSAKLGDGWRLPFKKELEILYTNKKIIGGFGDYYYWGSNLLDNVVDIGCLYNFHNGNWTNFYKEEIHFARAVRTISSESFYLSIFRRITKKT